MLYCASEIAASSIAAAMLNPSIGLCDLLFKDMDSTLMLCLPH